MIVTVQAVRAYGSSDYYGPSPRSVPDGSPIAIEEFPRARHRTLAYFGALPVAAVRANRVRAAIGRLMLDSLFGGHDTEMLPDDRIDRYLDSDEGPHVGTDHNWYVTFAVEKALDVEDAAIGAGRYMWLAPEIANEQIEATLDYASDGMDRLAAVASTVIDPRMFEDLVMGDRVFFSLAGRESFGLPEATGSAALSVGRQTMPLADLDERLQNAARASSARHAWLSSVQDLHLVALRERDPWKQFYWHFAVLEVLARKLAPIIEGPSMDRKDRHVRDDFKVLASHMFPERADEDGGIFARLNRQRNNIHSGGRSMPEDQLAAVRELHVRYFSTAIEMMLEDSAAL